jgi:hypothetical protein
MKKILTVFVAVAALSLTGCGMIPGGGNATPAPSETSAAPSQEATPAASDEATESAGATESAEPITSEESSAPETATDAAASGAYDAFDFVTGEVSDEEFVSNIRAKTTTLGDVSDNAILLIPGKTCATLANGGTFIEMMQQAGEAIDVSTTMNGKTAIQLNSEVGKDVGKLLGLGVVNYCPEYKQKLIESVPAGSL